MDTSAQARPVTGVVERDGQKVDTIYLALLASYIAKGGILAHATRGVDVEIQPRSYIGNAQECVPLKYHEFELSAVYKLAAYANFGKVKDLPWEANDHVICLSHILKLLPSHIQLWFVQLTEEYHRYNNPNVPAHQPAVRTCLHWFLNVLV